MAMRVSTSASYRKASKSGSDFMAAWVSIRGRNDVVSSNVVAAESETGGPESSSPALAELEVLEASDAFTVENFFMNKIIWQLLHSNSKDAAKNGDKIENALAGGYVGLPTTSTQKAGAGLVHVHEDFLITKVLGHGGHGAVFEARHKDFLNIRLAIKFQCLDKSNLAKFMVRELHLPTKLDKKFAVEMYGWYLLPSGKNKVVMAILMEIGDETLENFRDKQVEMAKNGSRQDRIDLLKTNLPILCDLMEVLEHINSCGVSHRDFKTENVLFVNGKPKIAGFGTAKENEFDTGGATKDVGTEGYQAPEAVPGEYTEKTDIYSFGCVFYEMVTGVLPSTVAKQDRLFKKAVFKIRPTIGPAVANLLEKLLASDASARLSAEEALTEINELIKIVDGDTSAETGEE